MYPLWVATIKHCLYFSLEYHTCRVYYFKYNLPEVKYYSKTISIDVSCVLQNTIRILSLFFISDISEFFLGVLYLHE